MKTYTVLQAENVPHYRTAQIEAADTADAIAKACAHDWTSVDSHPDYSQATARRIVEVTDDNETILAEFIAIDGSANRNFNR